MATTTVNGQDNLGQNGLASNKEEEDNEVKAGQDVEIMAETNNVSEAKNDCHVNKEAMCLIQSNGTMNQTVDEEAGSIAEKENLEPGKELATEVTDEAELSMDMQEEELESDSVMMEDQQNQKEKAKDHDGSATVDGEQKTDDRPSIPDNAESITDETANTKDECTNSQTEETAPDRDGSETSHNDDTSNSNDSESERDLEDNQPQEYAIIMADMEAISEALPLPEVVETVRDDDDEADGAVQVIDITLCNRVDVYLYRIPVDKGVRLEKASKWDLSNPVMTGTLSFTKTPDGRFVISIYDDDNHGALYASMEFSHYPSPKLYQTKDSTRYFIATLKNAKDGYTTAMGIGFYCSKKFIEALTTNVSPEPTFEPPKKRQKVVHKPLAPAEESPIPAKTTAEAIQAYIRSKYSCQFCIEDCKTKEQLKKHWAEDHGLRHPSYCPHCLDPFPSEAAMKMHRGIQHRYSCHKCTLNFVNDYEYLDHAYNTHGTGLLE